VDLVQIKVIISSHDLVQITHYNSPNYTDHIKWIYTEYTVLKIFSLFRILNNLRLPSKTVFLQNFHCIEYISYHSRFLSNSALTLKNRVCLEIFHCIQYTFTFRIFEQLALALNLLYWIYIFYSDVRLGSWLGRHCLFQSQVCECMNSME